MPAGFFLYLPFSEPLFFFLLCLLLWGVQRDRLLLAGMACFLCPLARPVGVLILPGVAGLAWRKKNLTLVLPLLTLAGFGSYLAYMKHCTGNAWEGFAAQSWHIHHPRLYYLLEPGRVLSAFLGVDSLWGVTDGIIDRLCFLAVIPLLILTWKLDRGLWLLIFPMAIVPALTNLFLSYRRFAIVLAPATIALAQWACSATTRQRTALWLCGVGLCIQLVLLREHLNGRWGG